MHGKVLVIDPIATNRIALRVKLAANHYEVLQAGSIAAAMQIIGKSRPDLIVATSALPDGASHKLIARLRKAKVFGKVPLIALCAHHDDGERLRLLSAGFDDVMTKPIDDTLLVARARSLMRASASIEEWRLRDGTSRALGFAERSADFRPAPVIRMVADDESTFTKWKTAIERRIDARFSLCPPNLAVKGCEDSDKPDVFVLAAEPGSTASTLGLLASLRTHADTRHCGVLVVMMDGSATQGAQMLDTGANDIAPEGASVEEIALRLEALLARKRVTDVLRDTVRNGIEAAVIDPLTGLHNRRYAMPHMKRIAERAQATAKPFAVLIADIDHFKQVNDAHGHAAGDAVLVEVAKRLQSNLRAQDLVARIGGEEFLMVLPGVTLDNARKAAMRLCRKVGNTPIRLPGSTTQVTATVSIGMIVVDVEADGATFGPLTAEALLDRADRALYEAKAEGRNRVTLSRTAA